MTETTPPEDWSKKSEAVPGPDRAYVYSVGEDARVIVGLATQATEKEKTRLEASTIEERGRLKRHDFVVEIYAGEEEGTEAMTTFMRFLTERFHTDTQEDQRLFRTVQECIEEFDSGNLESHP